jgi:uncharacterized protein YbaA (DUF1428 family)
MPTYVDGFVLPVPKKNLAAYRKIAAKAAKLFREHGALEVHECVGEDLTNNWGVSFPTLAQVKPGETVVFSWITYKSRAHRDRVNKKIHGDPRMAAMMAGQKMPMDCKRMAYGGFTTIVADV